jgi:hypothetical protein
LARDHAVADLARTLTQRAPDRMARLASVFSFVSHLVDVPPEADDPRDGVDLMLRLAPEREGPAVILAALLLALGERAGLDWAAGLCFVRVELELPDVARVPPHAGLIRARGRCFLPLDARQAKSPLGFLPCPVRAALAQAAR